MKVDIFSPFKKLLDPLYARWFKYINYIPKRIRVVICTAIMTLTLLVSSFFPFSEWWWFFGILLIIIAYLTTYIAVFEGIDGVEWYMLFIMPIFLTIALYIFYSLLPVRWLTRIPFLFLFGLTYYATLLASNILNIGVDKSLQLYRAAFSVNYLIQVFIVFLLTQVSLTFKLSFILNGLILFVIGIILSLQLYWSVNPEATFNKKLILYGVGMGIILLEIAVAVSFIPFKTNVAALIYTALYYSLNGVVYHYLDGRLFKNTIREYAFVSIFVFFIALLTLNW
ncbi:MAG TPA: hypothetical protein PLS49_01375 [Candidatus Woesebacteria bacterium]|nr:hypothetical protein [Candidatus Woesebacteria bacterium]